MSSHAHGVTAAIIHGFLEIWIFAALIFDRMNLTLGKFQYGPEEAPTIALNNVFTTLSPIAFIFGFLIYGGVAFIHALFRNYRSYPLGEDLKYNLSFCDGYYYCIWMGCALALFTYLLSWTFYDRRIEGQGLMFFLVAVIPFLVAFAFEIWRLKRWRNDVLLEIKSQPVE